MESPRPASAQESEWILRCQGGEREAFEFLVERYQRRIYSLVFRLVPRRDEVEDLAQEIFLKAFQGIRSYDARASFSTWLARVAVNHCYDYLRRQRASRLSYFWQMPEESFRALEARMETGGGGRPDAEEETALRDLVEKLLNRAPAADRIILVLKELEDRSVEEIAEILKLKESTVKVRLRRARKRMLEDLKRWRQRR